MTVPIRVSHIGSGIGPKIPLSIIVELSRLKATHVSFHANKISILDFQLRGQHRNANKEGRVIVSNVDCLEHIVQLDLSSNYLHEGCELSQFICHTTHSLLGMTYRLAMLNLASNSLTEKSLVALISRDKSQCHGPLLPCLRDLDVSHNNISVLPTNLFDLCPTLIHFNCMSNKLKSLASTLQGLQQFRGRIQSINLLNRNIGSDRNNPICAKRLYREKVVFILGSALIQLDGVKITSEEREAVRRRLGRNYAIACDVAETHPLRKQDHLPSSVDDCSYIATRGERHDDFMPQCYEEDKEISSLKLQVASLSAIIEKQTLATNNLIKAAQDYGVCDETRNERASTSDSGMFEIAGHREHDVEQEAAISRSYGIVVNRCRVAATSAVLRILFIERIRKRTQLLLAFSRWRLFLGFFEYAQEMKRLLSESKEKWQKKTDEIVKSAVSKEGQKSQEILSIMEKASRVANDRITELTAVIQGLEQTLQLERKKYRDKDKDSKDMIDRLQTNICQLRERNDDQTRLTSRVEADLEAATKELRETNERLDKEQTKLAHLEQSHRHSGEQAKDAAAVFSGNLDALKLENIQKDATITQLKIAFEEVAMKAATDRSKAEKASLAERQAKELLRKHNQKMSDLEAEIERLASAKEHLENMACKQSTRFADLQKQVQLKISNIADMSSEIDKLNHAVHEKNYHIEGLERKLKVDADALDKTHEQLKECRKAKVRWEERCEHLKSQLDKAHDELRAAKVCKDQKNLLDAEKSKNTELRNALDKQRQESKERELELRASAQLMHRENAMVRENYLSQEKWAKSLERKLRKAQGEWKLREAKLVSSHSVELREIKNICERENMSYKNALESERLLRLEAERRVAILEASQHEQKAKMQSAIEGLAQQLTQT